MLRGRALGSRSPFSGSGPTCWPRWWSQQGPTATRSSTSAAPDQEGRPAAPWHPSASALGRYSGSPRHSGTHLKALLDAPTLIAFAMTPLYVPRTSAFSVVPFPRPARPPSPMASTAGSGSRLGDGLVHRGHVVDTTQSLELFVDPLGGRRGRLSKSGRGLRDRPSRAASAKGDGSNGGGPGLNEDRKPAGLPALVLVSAGHIGPARLGPFRRFRRADRTKERPQLFQPPRITTAPKTCAASVWGSRASCPDGPIGLPCLVLRTAT
jgi:hypothetical protein